MNRRQRGILINFIVVITITTVAVVAMINFKDWVNHSEAMRAMEQLGQIALEYRQERGWVPSESYVDSIIGDLEGQARFGGLHYRARWIDIESTPDEILAYTKRDYNSLILDGGYVVLRLDGRVEWMGVQEFEDLLAKQQSPMEIQMLQD